MKKQVYLKPGDKYNRLTVISFDHKDKHPHSYYLFRCDCGNEKIIIGSAVVSGSIKSCGCLVGEFGDSRRISENHSEVTAIILGYKRHAIRRGFKFQLDREQVKHIIKQDCAYCGAKPSNHIKTKNSHNGGMDYNGIDRVNSSLDYTLDNVVPCCGFCNKAKGKLSKQEFIEKAKQIYQRSMATQWG